MGDPVRRATKAGNSAVTSGLPAFRVGQRPADRVKRITGYKLQKIRKRVLSNKPLCVRCEEEGRITEAVEVDHIDPLFKGGAEDEYDDSNRQPLCKSCHAVKTAHDLGYQPNLGVAVDGRPLDPNHHWNRR